MSELVFALDKSLVTLPRKWTGIPIGKFHVIVDGERGESRTDAPSVLMCISGNGLRWHRHGAKTTQYQGYSGLIDLMGKEYQRDWGRWKMTPGHTVGLVLDPLSIQRLVPEWDSFDLKTEFSLKDTTVRWLLTELLAEASRGASDGPLYSESISCALIARLNRFYGTQKADDEIAGTLSAPNKKLVVDYIEANLKEEISIVALAGLLGLGARHFTHCFTASFGISPHQYVLRRRITLAQKALALSSRSLTEIAHDLGFCSHAHFTKTFRKYIGETPSEFRMINRGKL